MYRDCLFTRKHQCARDGGGIWWHSPSLKKQLQLWKVAKANIVEHGGNVKAKTHCGKLEVINPNGRINHNPFEQVELHQDKIVELCYQNGCEWRQKRNGIVKECRVCGALRN